VFGGIRTRGQIGWLACRAALSSVVRIVFTHRSSSFVYARLQVLEHVGVSDPGMSVLDVNIDEEG
jgi:hypothetical protein